MNIRSLLVACALLAGASPLHAENRVFIVANQSDGYGVDQCLARGEKCGSYAARAFCQSHEFGDVAAFRRVDADEITGAVPVSTGDHCPRGGCSEYVAITCQR
jgi:hypothetical protein